MPDKYVISCSLTYEQRYVLQAVLDKMQCEYSVAILIGDGAEEDHPVFRFELFFNGEYQGVGLLTGLEDICGPATYRKLIKPFNDNLPIPLDIKGRCSFWFTEKGLETFAPAIDAINHYIKEKGWEIRGTFLYVHISEILYKDELQVALDEDMANEESFVPFANAMEMMTLFEAEYA